MIHPVESASPSRAARIQTGEMKRNAADDFLRAVRVPCEAPYFMSWTEVATVTAKPFSSPTCCLFTCRRLRQQLGARLGAAVAVLRGAVQVALRRDFA